PPPARFPGGSSAPRPRTSTPSGPGGTGRWGAAPAFLSPRRRRAPVLHASRPADRESNMHTLYGNSTSGNCWKPAVMLHARGLPFRWIEIDILKGESRTPEFLKLNPNGRVPLLVFPDGRTLAEPNPIALHLGEGYSALP